MTYSDKINEAVRWIESQCAYCCERDCFRCWIKDAKDNGDDGLLEVFDYINREE